YDIKYPYKYRSLNTDGQLCHFYTIHINDLIKLYQSYMTNSAPPTTFFDCGCGPGELIRQAEELGIQAKGIDVQRYPIVRREEVINLHAVLSANVPREIADHVIRALPVDYSAQQSKIEIASIANYDKAINADLAFCNGSLTYLAENELEPALARLAGSKMLIAIHNTTEDISAAKRQKNDLLDGAKRRLIKPINWWVACFAAAGFNVEFDKTFGCFCLMPQRLL
ncbi:MAG: hypothetical protein FWG18_03455, partial [Alphaproteobacteria bacterium]|nr:hypothetical protein [Alphaproteobacteria bacterium]